MHIILFLTWLLTLGASLLIDANLIADHPPLKLTLRLTSSFLLVLAAAYTITRVNKDRRMIAILIALGMFFGFLGDCAMAGLLTFFPSPVIGGMLFFSIGHIAYITAAELTRRHFKLPAKGEWWTAIITYQIIGILFWVFFVHRSEYFVPLHLPTLAYGVLLAGTAGFAHGLMFLNRRFVMIAIGSALFFVSDSIIAFDMFHWGAEGPLPLVWPTYGPGQMLIVFGYAYALSNNHATVSNN